MTNTRLSRLAAAALLLVACNEDAPAPEFYGTGAPSSGMTASIGYDGVFRGGSERTSLYQAEPALAAADSGDKVISSAELRLEVPSVAAAITRIDSLVRAGGGMVSNRQQFGGANAKQNANLTLRVPAVSFGSLMDTLRALGDVLHDGATQQDVTKEYVDLQTRLAVKEQALVRLRQLLANRTARLVDVLEVEREITRLVTEIERMKGERRFYDDRVAFATIDLRLFEPGSGRTRGFTVGKALSQSLETLSTSFAWLVYVVIFLAPWLLIATVIYRIAQRIHNATKQQ
jgi:hypothetical protein